MNWNWAAELMGRVAEDSTGDAAYDLLGEFQRGFPLANLRELLRSSDARKVEVGAWIASELGPSATPVLSTMVDLLGHPSADVRFSVLDVILACGRHGDGQSVAKALPLIADPKEAIRWKMMNVLARIDASELIAAVPYVGDRHLRKLLEWMINTVRSTDLTAVTRLLASEDEIEQLFAAAVAARLAPDVIEGLEAAERSHSDLVSSFALEQRRRWR